MTDDDIIDGILEREGAFVDRPEDRGGPTKFGITARTLSIWRGRVVTADDVETLTAEEARQILRRLYLDRPGLQAVADGPLRRLLVDCAVNHGPDDATRWLQRALKLDQVDGMLGSRTRDALAAAEPRRVYLSVCAQRIRRYGDLITRRPGHLRLRLDEPGGRLRGDGAMTAHGPSGWMDERLQKETPAGEEDVLLLVRRRDYPIALCGRVVHDEFNPHRSDTAGRDRCTDCLIVLRDLRRREA